jgi:lysine-N-methylase
VQSAHGAATLPSVCATYPRVVTRIASRLSLTATLSCPEAARLCLLAADACAVEPADPAPLAGLLVRRHVPPAGRDPLVRHFLPVRDAFLDLLARSEYPLRSRLAFTVHLARRLDAVRAAERGTAAGAGVQDAIDAVRAPAMLDRLDRECRAVTAPGPAAFALVQQILFATLRRQHASRLASLVHAAQAPPPQGPGAMPEDGAPAWGGREQAAAYVRSRDAWEAAFADRIAQVLTNYVANLWLQEPFTTSPDLVAHVLGHMARVAAVRLLLFLHPALRELGSPRATDARHGEALDRAAVEVVYTFSRAVEHGPGMGALLQQIVAEHRVKGRRRTLELAAF